MVVSDAVHVQFVILTYSCLTAFNETVVVYITVLLF